MVDGVGQSATRCKGGKGSNIFYTYKGQDVADLYDCKRPEKERHIKEKRLKVGKEADISFEV